MQTIIECLKQACTGELPPNTRNGQSFIHDPKACLHCCVCQLSAGTLQHKASMSCVLQVAGETEVKAQIKLRFRTATSQPVVVIRTFQVCYKAACHPAIHTDYLLHGCSLHRRRLLFSLRRWIKPCRPSTGTQDRSRPCPTDVQT